MGSRLGVCQSGETEPDCDTETPRKVGVVVAEAAVPSERSFAAAAANHPALRRPSADSSRGLVVLRDNTVGDKAHLRHECYMPSMERVSADNRDERTCSILPRCCAQKASGEALAEEIEHPDVVAAVATDHTNFPCPEGSQDVDTVPHRGSADARDLISNGQRHLRNHGWTAAEEAFAAAIDMGTGTEEPLAKDVIMALAFAGRGRARLRLGRLEEAEKDLADALHMDPGLAPAASDHSEAKLRMYLQPLDGKALLDRGKAKLAMREYRSATVDLVLAVRLGCQEAQVELDRATALEAAEMHPANGHGPPPQTQAEQNSELHSATASPAAEVHPSVGHDSPPR